MLISLQQYPSTPPLIVYAGVGDVYDVNALRAYEAPTLMVSFEKIRDHAPRFHETLEPLMDWPVRKYLDSGLYTLMRQFDVSRTKNTRAKKNPLTAREAYLKLAREYANYLTQYSYLWDHIVELDVDQILGEQYTRTTRKILRGIVGDKLLPVWHVSGGDESWQRLINEFKYVAIGGDIATISQSSSSMKMMYRVMVQQAHDKGVLVHGLGDTTRGSFHEIGWDTADSSSWLSGARFGRLLGYRYSDKETVTLSAKDRSLYRHLTDLWTSHGLDLAAVAGAGRKHPDKLKAAVLFTQLYQQDLWDKLGSRYTVVQPV